MTVPIYRDNPLIMEVSMLCPGISQNTKLHHLTLYKGQIWEEKPYPELCNHNVLNIVYDKYGLIPGDRMAKYNELYVPPVPGEGFIKDKTNIPWDSEILQSFAQLTDITDINFKSYNSSQDSLEHLSYQIEVVSRSCSVGVPHHLQCVPPTKHNPWYIWTKEGFKIQIIIYMI